MRSSSSGVAVFALLLTTACVAPKSDADSRTVRDSAGVQIVENMLPASAVAPFTLDPAPVIDLGASANAHEEFSGVVLPVRLADGRLVVANGGSHELRVYDSNGKWQQSIGRDGEGPGEFRSLGWLQLGVGDTIRTYDWSLLRISVFAPSGTFQRATYLGAPGEFVGIRPVGVMSDGRIVTSTQNAVTINAKAGVHRDTVALLAYDATGRLRDTLGHYPGSEAWVARGPNSVSVSARPFGREFFAVPHGSSLIVGTADNPEVHYVNADGRVSRIVRWSASKRPVTAADIDAYITTAGEGWEPGSEEKRKRYVETLRNAPYPEEMPAYAAILVSPDGSLWIRRFADRATPAEGTFDVIDSTGAWQGAVQMPSQFTPTQILAGYAVGTWRDPDDILHVRVYRIVRRR